MRAGATLLELATVLAIAALLASIAVPRAVSVVDGLATRAALRETVAAYAATRRLALARGAYATLLVDPATASLTVRVAGDTVHALSVGARYQVTLAATRDSLAYAPNGLGYGAANHRLVLRRGAAAETVYVSRLGRVRW